MSLVCPTDVASPYLAADPAKRKTDCPAILTGGSGLGEAVATAAPGSGTTSGSSPTNTAGTGGATATSTAGAAGMAMPIAGGVMAGIVGGLAVLL